MASSPGDGRNIDPRLGSLTGEAADQQVPAARSAPRGTMPYDVWTQVPGRDGSDPTYYDRPLLKEPVWIWSVPAYFFAGGVGGAASTLGLVARASRRRGLKQLERRCHLMGTVAGIVSTFLLIHDLGRPSRFLNMLRVFRPSSPMSVGSWVLAAYAPATTLAAVASDADGVLGSLGTAAAAGAGVLGMPLAGYTAVLVSNTAVPVWQQTRRSLPALFASSAVAGAASLLELLPLGDEEAAAVRRFGVLGKAAELASAEVVHHEAGEVPAVGRALDEGVAGRLWRAARTLTGVSLVLSLLPRPSARRRRVSGLLGALGSLAVKFAVFHAGKASAADPRATFHQQRAGA